MFAFFFVLCFCFVFRVFLLRWFCFAFCVLCVFFFLRFEFSFGFFSDFVFPGLVLVCFVAVCVLGVSCCGFFLLRVLFFGLFFCWGGGCVFVCV